MSGHGTPRVPPTGAAPIPSGGTALPTNFAYGPFVYLSGQVLPPAGAYTTAQQKELLLGTKKLTFAIEYTRGAAGGYPLFRPYFYTGLFGLGEGYNTIADQASFAAAAPFGVLPFYAEQLKGPIPADATALKYMLTFELPAFCKFFDLFAAEGGVVGTPGTVTVRYTGEG